MHLSHRTFLLEFKHPFGVSSNTRKETPTVFIKLEAENRIGFGEACLPAYLGETVDSTIAFFESAKPVLLNYDPTLPLQFFRDEINALSPFNNAAKAAIDIALHDLYGKILNQPYWEMMDLPMSRPVATAFTIGIDTGDKMELKIEEADEFPVLKIKAGTANDKELVGLIRKYTDKPLYIDVNQGWHDKHMVLDMIGWLQDQNVILVEQPMPVAMKEEMKWVTARSPLPIIADESVKRLADLEQLEGSFSGINIKLMKCTGLTEAIQMIGYAREHGLKIMLGCMAESSCATTAMAQLMQFADYLDLDAPLLYKNDPFSGITYQQGRVHLNELPGIGANPHIQLW